MYLFVFWLRIGHPLITYATGEIDAGSSKMCTGAYRERRVQKSVIRYIRTKWIAPNKCCGIFFVQ